MRAHGPNDKDEETSMTHTTGQPDVESVHVWNGQRTDELDQWLEGIAHHYEGDQLVIDAIDDERVQRPDIGWLMIRWTDGDFSMASGRIAERVYGENGLYGRLRRAEAVMGRQGTPMDFSDALRILKNGGTVRRKAWDALAHIPREAKQLRLMSLKEGVEPTLVITTNDDRLAVHHPSLYQILAEDWEVV